MNAHPAAITFTSVSGNFLMSLLLLQQSLSATRSHSSIPACGILLPTSVVIEVLSIFDFMASADDAQTLLLE